MWLGLGAAFLASLIFGTQFVPLKKFSRGGDGMMCQLFVSLGGFTVASIVQAALGFPTIYPLAMLGGMLWCIANSVAIPIMNTLGMALGILIWNTTNCLTGWAVPRFGFFGLKQSVPKDVILNYIGIAVLIVGGFFYLFIKSSLSNLSESDDDDDEDNIKGKKGSFTPATDELDVERDDNKGLMKRIIAVIASLISGLFYGNLLTPISYMQTNSAELSYPSDGLPYVFSFFLGVLLTSVVIFVFYSLVKKNSPIMESYMVLPSLTSGVIFGSAITVFFVAVQMLSQTICYPICTMIPGLVISLWSVLYFREITGQRNLTFLVVAYTLTLIGVMMVALSKDYQFF